MRVEDDGHHHGVTVLAALLHEAVVAWPPVVACGEVVLITMALRASSPGAVVACPVVSSFARTRHLFVAICALAQHMPDISEVN